MSRWKMLRSLGQCCLGKMDLLMAGGAAEVLPVPLNCPLPLLRIHPPSMLVCCFLLLVSTAFGRLAKLCFRDASAIAWVAQTYVRVQTYMFLFHGISDNCCQGWVIRTFDVLYGIIRY
jgi:hypothetical protein